MFLRLAGIDITAFIPQSTRSASSSKANNIGFSKKDIAQAAGWSNDSTFKKYYKRPVQKNFETTILHGHELNHKMF